MKVSEIVYNRYNVENLINTYKKSTKIIKNAKSVEDVLTARQTALNEYVKLDTAYNLAYIRWSLNTVDEFYINEKQYYDENLPLIADSKTEYVKAILNSKFKNDLEKLLPRTLFPLYNCELICDNPIIINDVIKENLEATKYSNFISGFTVNFNGEEIPFTVLKKYMQDGDRLVRKSAYQSLGSALQNNAEFLDNNFDILVKIRTEMAKKLGFDNFVTLGYNRMNRICYGISDIENFRQNVIKYIVPTVCEIKRKIADIIGINELKLYDNDVILKTDVFPIKRDIELFNVGKEIYSLMSEDTAKFFNLMLETEAFDCLSRKNKWGGGYQTDLKLYKIPFILANFNGSSMDADVLTHEAGHAYASYVMSKNNADIEVGLPCMDIAETHSMSMEFFCWKYIDKIFGSNADKYKFKHFVDSITFIPYGVMVDAFQEEVYKNYNFTAKERNILWKTLEKTFRPYMNADGITYLQDGTRWQYQMHIFESPFYYIDYALSQVTALQFLFLSLEDYNLAFKKYEEFISYGADYNFLDIIKKVGLKSPFEENTLKEIAQKSLELFNKLQKSINWQKA